MRNLFLAAFCAPLLLCACANKSTTSIALEDASQPHKARMGTILSHRSVSIRSDSAAMVGGGAFLGGAGGAVIGQTNGSTLAGLLIGGLAGELLHDLVETDNGVEYVIALSDGSTVIVAQIQRSSEPVLQKGDRVLVQFGAKTNRVISAADLPEKIAAPREVRIGNIAPPDKLQVRTCDKGDHGESVRETCTTF